ncbi:hypothetical protein AVEN_32807-1 [Araneus ventricosus]|uniref:Uncharacterized protein n=1 Tax=Araneus ventricosus TaxID=182803 RepID=A0A4Y2SUM4_ARAVE|nr:hypothetical protein AVEN_32807-1 [Araneus ventricosus]
MRSKAENKFSEELLKSLFLQRLPTHVRQILAISNDNLDRLAEMADGIMASATDTVAIQAVTSVAANLENNAGGDLFTPVSPRSTFEVPFPGIWKAIST